MDNWPNAIETPYNMVRPNEPNEPLILFCGQAEISETAGWHARDVTVTLELVPRANIVIRYSGDDPETD